MATATGSSSLQVLYLWQRNGLVVLLVDVGGLGVEKVEGGCFRAVFCES